MIIEAQIHMTLAKLDSPHLQSLIFQEAKAG